MGVPSYRNVLPVLLAVLLCGCTAGEIELYEPEGSGLAQGLTAKVELEAAGAEIGEALGWSEGVPGAEVRVHRIGTEHRWQTALTDSNGVAEFLDLLPGRYRVAAHRVLSDEEAALLGGRRRAFADGRIIELTEARTLTLTLLPDQRGSLLFSELYAGAPPLTEMDYDWAPYFELYNNSDTMIYLDGKILGWAYPIDGDYGPWHCDQTAVFRNDPDGIWAEIYYHRFPGSGTEYPLAPGGIVVLAMDAVDHSQFYSGLPDLSHADFEFIGPADVNNPEVPDMVEGLGSWHGGHGLRPDILMTYFLSEPVDIQTLPRMWDEWGQSAQEFIFFPSELLLDVLATEDAEPLEEQKYPPCTEKVHRNFDRLAGGYVGHEESLVFSVQRVVLDVTPDGRAVLQDTNTSAVDLIRALYTVGTVSERD